MKKMQIHTIVKRDLSGNEMKRWPSGQQCEKEEGFKVNVLAKLIKYHGGRYRKGDAVYEFDDRPVERPKDGPVMTEEQYRYICGIIRLMYVRRHLPRLGKADWEDFTCDVVEYVNRQWYKWDESRCKWKWWARKVLDLVFNSIVHRWFGTSRPKTWTMDEMEEWQEPPVCSETLEETVERCFEEGRMKELVKLRLKGFGMVAIMKRLRMGRKTYNRMMEEIRQILLEK